MRLFKWLGIIAAFGALGLGLGLGLNLAQYSQIKNDVARIIGWSPGAKAVAQATGLHTAPTNPLRRSARHTIVVDIAQAVSPAVVSIGVTKTTYVRQYNDFGGDLFFSPYILGKSDQKFPYLGSGFIIDKKGHVITNYHVVEDSNSINVTLTDKRTFQARLLDADRYVDVALLQIEGLKGTEDLPTIPMGNSNDIMIGETVLAVGNPFGPLIADPRPSVSVGVVSAVQRTFKADEQSRIYQDMIQTDAAINPGNSGGPLINLDGEVIGINTFILSRSGDSSSVGFSIPINRATKVVEEILRFGKIRSIRLDFEVTRLTPYIIHTLNLAIKSGALVRQIDTDGPARKAGLEPGDVIVRADDKEIQNETDLLTYFLTRTVGEAIKLRVIRDGKPLDLHYQIIEGSSS